MKLNIGPIFILSGFSFLVWVDCSIIIVEDAKGEFTKTFQVIS